MATRNDDLSSLDDPSLEREEWLFRKEGQVFGPVRPRHLAEMLYRGEIEPFTPVSNADGGDASRWTPVGEVPLFAHHARRASGRYHYRSNLPTGGTLFSSRGRHRPLAAGIAVVGLLLAVWAVRRVWYIPAESRLLADFGEGIRIVSSARHTPPGVEVAPVSPSRPGTRSARRSDRAAPALRSSSPVSHEGALVEASFDAKAIRAHVLRQQATLAPCFREEASRTHDTRGRVPLEFAIGNDGRVAALWVLEPRLKDGPLRECIWTAMASWRFDPFPGERPMVQLTFEVGR